MDQGHPTFSEAEQARRFALANDILARLNLDGLVVYGSRSAGADVQYLTDWPPTREAYFVLGPAIEPVLLVQLSNHVDAARQMSWVKDVRFAGTNESGGVDSGAALLEQVARLSQGPMRVGLAGPIPYQHYVALGEHFPDAIWVDCGRELRRARSIKSPEELGRIAKAAQISDLAMRRLQSELRPGLTEFDVARIVDDVHSEHGASTTVRHLLSTSMEQPTVAVPYQYPTSRRLAKGDVVVLELSGAVWGYSGQILRTFAIGAEPPPLYRKLHDTAVQAYHGIVDVLRAGSTVEDVHRASDIIEAAGFTIVDDLLHGAGQLPPILRTRATSRGVPAGFEFQTDMCVVVQPNVATPDRRAGVQHGAMLRVMETGTEVLHDLTDEFVVCG